MAEVFPEEESSFWNPEETALLEEEYLLEFQALEALEEEISCIWEDSYSLKKRKKHIFMGSPIDSMGVVDLILFGMLLSTIFMVVVHVGSGMLLFRVHRTYGESMNPTFYQGDLCFVWRRFSEIRTGDVISFWLPQEGEQFFLGKRVIATGGQTVVLDYNRNELWVDDVLLVEEYLAEDLWMKPRSNEVDYPLLVPEGMLFVLGDNRNESTDSRSSYVGFVDEDCVFGKLFYVISHKRELAFFVKNQL